VPLALPVVVTEQAPAVKLELAGAQPSKARTSAATPADRIGFPRLTLKAAHLAQMLSRGATLGATLTRAGRENHGREIDAGVVRQAGWSIASRERGVHERARRRGLADRPQPGASYADIRINRYRQQSLFSRKIASRTRRPANARASASACWWTASGGSRRPAG